MVFLLQVAGKKRNCRNLIFHKGKCMLLWCYSHHKDWSWRNKGPQAESLALAEVFRSLVIAVMQVVQPSQVLFLLCMLVTVLSVILCKDKVPWLQPLLPSKIALHIQGELMSQNFAGSMFCPSQLLPAAVVTNLAAHESSVDHVSTSLDPFAFYKGVCSKPHICLFFPSGSFDFCNF